MSAFQREYVWKRDDAKLLIDSLIKEYPTGTMLTWETADPPELKGPHKYDKKQGAVRILLDGQQRVTTLFSSHNLDDVSEIATDLVVIHEGRSIYADRMSAVRSELRLIEARDFSGGPPPTIQALVIKAVQQGSTAYWLVRNGTHAIDEELIHQNEASFRAHSLSLEGMFLFLTRGWIELGKNGTPSR